MSYFYFRMMVTVLLSLSLVGGSLLSFNAEKTRHELEHGTILTVLAETHTHAFLEQDPRLGTVQSHLLTHKILHALDHLQLFGLSSVFKRLPVLPTSREYTDEYQLVWISYLSDTPTRPPQV